MSYLLTVLADPRSPLVPSNVDLAITPQAGGGAGINLALDPALAIYGWDVDWDVGMDWGNMGLGGGRREGGEGEGQIEFGSGVERDGECFLLRLDALLEAQWKD